MNTPTKTAKPQALVIKTQGGTTGYAINPARDFGPRLMYQMLPRKNKDADWSYAWIPVLGPFAGGALAGLAYTFCN